LDNTGTFLKDLALILCVAGVTTLIFQRLRQPVVLGYLVAGLLLGPHAPFHLISNEATVHTLAQLGVILVMFSIGLEFNLMGLRAMLPTAGITSLVEISVMLWLGYTLGHLMGLTPLQCLFTGAMLSISSTMIASKALSEQHKGGPLNRMVFGVLVMQDLAAVLMLALLTPLAQGSRFSFSQLMTVGGGLLGFLAVLFLAGYLLIPRLMRAVIALRNPETILVVSVGVCFAFSLLAQRGGYSLALGAFLAGILTAESGAAETIERLVAPLKDMFSAVFFVAVGMLVNPSVLLNHWVLILAGALIVAAGLTFSVAGGAFLSGKPLRTAVQAGMSLAQIGEFSFIIAQMGVDKKAIPSFVYDMVVGISVLTIFATPWLVRASEPLSRWIDSRLPRPLQTFSALYGSWLEDLRKERAVQTLGGRAGRLVRFLLMDTLCLAAVIITVAATQKIWLPPLGEMLGLSPFLSRVLLLAAGLIPASPFLLGVFRNARTLGGLLAAASIPHSEPGQVDLGLAPRSVLTLALQLGVVLAVGVPLLAVTQPFLPFGFSLIVLAVLLIALGVFFWKSAVNLQEHVRAGAQMVADALTHHSPQNQDQFLEQVNVMVPGIGAPTSVFIESLSPVAGLTLGECNLRSKTGASVIAIVRGEERLLMPSGSETIRPGDNLILIGTQEAILSAKEAVRPEAG
jgi:CPA2 family monovalent cation:H+ antiporter-2